MIVGIEDIRISKSYINTTPNPDKYSAKLNSYLKGGVLSPIIVDENMKLIDGYISYLILRYSGAKSVEVYYENELPIIFIDGHHPHSVKSYTWCVPRKLKNKFTKKVKVGDVVRCRVSNNKVVPVIVDKIYTGNKKDRDYAPVIAF
jgi:hypothetical protein